ncbi:MAG TPA: hypothetical protein PLL78_14045 [Fimbriimonadaceae bacterium]|nr:hypothetical protein [Fimbriimonadaceae bacterium]HRJ97798.1 hypothetical protein [Fimbriimonadaceae bacterium]
MDFVERLTGLELDGGTGALEWLILLAPVLLAGVLLWRRRASARP